MRIRPFIYLSIATLIDILLTFRGLSERGEKNPLYHYYMKLMGDFPGIAIPKLIMIGCAIFLLAVAAKRGWKVHPILYAGTAYTLLLSSSWLV
jgi:hypothetical protein